MVNSHPVSMKAFVLLNLFAIGAVAKNSNTKRNLFVGEKKKTRRQLSSKKSATETSNCVPIEYDIELVDSFDESFALDLDLNFNAQFYGSVEKVTYNAEFVSLGGAEISSAGGDGVCINPNPTSPSSSSNKIFFNVCVGDITSSGPEFAKGDFGFDQAFTKLKVAIGGAEFDFPKEDTLPQDGTACCMFTWLDSNPDEFDSINCFNGSLRRKLEFTPLSQEELQKTVRSTRADVDGLLVKREGVISKESCVKAQDYFATAWSNGLVGDKNHHGGYNTEKHFEFFATAEQLISVIGKDDAKALYNFFQDSLGYKAPVTKIVFQHFDTREQVSSSPFHTHKSAELVAFVRDQGEGIQGGGMAHIVANKDGEENGNGETERTLEIVDSGNGAGTAFVQGPLVPHGMHSYTGVREVILFITNPMATAQDDLFDGIFV